jgi:ubiquinone/menaquinone biosynthesis C-methylase UbiE
VLVRLIDAITKNNTFQKKSLARVLGKMGRRERKEIEEYAAVYLLYLLNKGYSIEEIAADYNWMCREILKEQVYFKRCGHYRYASLADTVKNVYDNVAYMRRYMIGVGISQMLWENHQAMFAFWARNLRSLRGAIYLEVGVGHGMFFRTALKNGNFQKYIAVDISQTSLAMTKELTGPLAEGKNIDWILSDVLDLDVYDQSVDFLTMGEVLEHVEQPGKLMAKITTMLKPAARAYISTCANAPVVDHIYLFNDVDQIRKELQTKGLTIADEMVTCNDETPPELWVEQKANLSYAAILEKNE